MTTKTSSEKPLTPVASGEREAPSLRPLRLRHNFLWTLAGFGVYGASELGKQVAVGRLGSPEMLGSYSLALAICAPIVMFTNLQLRNIQATDAKREYKFGDYLGLRIAGTTIALFAITLVALAMLIFGKDFADFSVILMIGLAKSAESMSDVIFGLLQKWERLDLSARSQMIKGPGGLLALACFIYFTHQLVWGAFGVLLVWALGLLTYDLYNARRVLAAFTLHEELHPDFSGRLLEIKKLTLLTLPMGFVGLLDSLNVNVPRYFIAHHLGKESLGFFTAMTGFIVAGNLVVIALATSSASQLSRAYQKSAGSFARLIVRLAAFGAVLGLTVFILAYFFGPYFLAIYFKAEYQAKIAQYQTVFLWLMAAAGIGYIYRFLIYSMTAARHLNCQAPLYAISLGVQAGLSAWFIPTNGLLGAAWAVFAGMVVILLGAILINIHAIRHRSLRGGEEPVPLDLSGEAG